MKALASGAAPHTASHATERAGEALVRIWRAARSIASDTLLAIQIARMASVLNGMRDDQLAQIGIARHQIYSHAEHLVLDVRDAPDEPESK